MQNQADSILSHSKQAPYYRFRVPYSQKLFAQIADFLDITGDTEVMDAGCGTGHVTDHLVKFAKHVHAVDGSDEMLKRAQNYSNASYYLRDLNKEKFELTNGVSHIFFGRCIHHFSSDSVRSLIDDNLIKGGSIVTCSSEWFAEGGWDAAYYELRKKYEEDENTSKRDVTGQSNLLPIGLKPEKKFVDAFKVLVDTRYLTRLTLARAYGKTFTNLQNDFDNFEKEMAKVMSPFLTENRLSMIIRSWAYVWRDATKINESS